MNEIKIIDFIRKSLMRMDDSADKDILLAELLLLRKVIDCVPSYEVGTILKAVCGEDENA